MDRTCSVSRRRRRLSAGEIRGVEEAVARCDGMRRAAITPFHGDGMSGSPLGGFRKEEETCFRDAKETDDHAFQANRRTDTVLKFFVIR